MLTKETIQELAARPGVKKVAVENFLGTLGTMTLGNALDNLASDAQAYGWSAETIAAIFEGIHDHFGY